MKESKKKILFLGSYYTEVVLVGRAKELGYYTIVTDNHDDAPHIPAKAVADECWDISWTDIDAMEARCKEVGVEGVIGGFSERRVESMILLCNRLGLPCSLTMEQLDITRDKLKFKDACRANGIPCVPEYQYGDIIKLPVIVKPVDRAGSIGINVAYTMKEFERDYQYALSLSDSKQVIIEDYIGDGVKFDIYYYVQDGNIVYLGSSDTIMCKGSEGSEILQKAWPFPSKYEHQFLEEEERHVRSMIRHLGINNCYLTMSAFYRKGCFYFFEAGFRLSGEMSYNYFKAISGIDYLDIFLRYAMGEQEHIEIKEIRNRGIYSLVLNFFGKDGKVGSIEGVEKIQSLPSVIHFLLYVKKGELIFNETKVLKKIAMCTICCQSLKELELVVSFVNSSFSVKGSHGEELIYEKLSVEEIEYYEAN